MKPDEEQVILEAMFVVAFGSIIIAAGFAPGQFTHEVEVVDDAMTYAKEAAKRILRERANEEKNKIG